MRRKLFKGKEILLTNKDWKQIRKRFNSKNVIFGYFTTYEYPCHLCKKHPDYFCKGCPFKKFYKDDHPGCLCVAGAILGKRGRTFFNSITHDELDKIVRWLDSFEVVK